MDNIKDFYNGRKSCHITVIHTWPVCGLDSGATLYFYPRFISHHTFPMKMPLLYSAMKCTHWPVPELITYFAYTDNHIVIYPIRYASVIPNKSLYSIIAHNTLYLG